ncbi:MAG TPA: hypothetical protein DD636_02320 [Anaerolineaceae bacterium]|jgi:hypothetical protein|nr:hypothetical protein [Anaerolineaceae bacterium]
MRSNKTKCLSAAAKLLVAATLLIASLGLNLPPSQPQDVFALAGSTCLNRANIAPEDFQWVYVPESADEFFTDEPYYYLAGQLIVNKVVDASYCPSGGLMLNDYANACGMAAAMDTVITVQNLVNEPILQAFKDVGTPPVLLKQLIRYESQFWPANADEIHYGYGHMTNIGMRNALEWNPDLEGKVCPAGSACASSTKIAGDVLNSLVATCPTCQYGVDINTAYRSVDVLAESLLGYCYQTALIVFNATGWHSSLVVDYATIWKLTLMNYNAGPNCTYNTIANAFRFTQGPIRWSDVSAYVTGEACIRGLAYANQITTKAYNFSPLD